MDPIISSIWPRASSSVWPRFFMLFVGGR
jgi:hypothetical protein